MKDTILLLTNSIDGEHTDAVRNRLSQRGAKSFRLDVDRLAVGDTKLRFKFDQRSFGFEFNDGKETLHSSEISSVWYRRPNQFDFKIKDPKQRDFAEKEFRSILDGLWSTLSNCNWISNPDSLARSRRKILQWQVARDIGFSVPDTIATNDSECLLDFYESHGRRVVVKSMEQAYLEYDTVAYNMPTTLLPASALGKLDLITRLPVLFQECVAKSYELRVTVVKKDFFPVRIDSQEFPETQIDWRHPRFINRLRHSLVVLPSEVQERCSQMLQVLGLSFGAFDIIVTPEGRFVFLEVNPNGQWYWMEHLIGVPISDSLAKNLLV